MAARDPLGRVSTVRTRREANHLRSELRYSLESEHLPAHQEHEHEEALSLLEERFPAAPRRSRRATPPAHEGRRRRAASGSAPGTRRPSAPARTRRAAQAAAAAAPTQEASNAAGALGDLAAPLTDSATDVMLGAARAGLLLALLYLILSNRGSRGLSGVLNAFTAVTTAFFSASADPLAALNGMPFNPVGATVPVTRANDPTADPTGRPQDIPLARVRRPLVPRTPVTRSH